MGFYKSFRIANILTNLFSSKNIAKIVLFGVILLIIGMLFSNNVLATSTDVDISSLENAHIDNNTILSEDGYILYYFKTEPGFVYHITNIGSSGWKLYFSNNISIGESVSSLTSISSNNTYDFVGTGDYFISYNSNSHGDNLMSVTYDFSQDFPGVSQDLASTFSLSNLWAQFGFAIPLIAVAVLFAIGYLIVRKLSKGTSKGNVKF